jgi:hypothetical protein
MVVVVLFNYEFPEWCVAITVIKNFLVIKIWSTPFILSFFFVAKDF